MRHKLSASLARELPIAPDDPAARAVRQSDAPALADLMLAAYRGTIDDSGEGPEEAQAEVQTLLSGGYGSFDFASSEAIERDGAIVAATLVTHFEGVPLVAFSMTAAPWQRRGLARAGLLRAMARLRSAGFAQVRLVVTEGNVPAEALYAALGFVAASIPPRDPAS